MVLAHAPKIDLPLLCEPDRPAEGQRAFHGWSRHSGIRNRVSWEELHREHGDDEFGARVQWAIVRYVLHGVKRSEIAADLCVTETTAQSYLLGKAWTAYGQPILRTLKRLGISEGRSFTRDREIQAAQRMVLARAAVVVDGAVLTAAQSKRLRFELRLLTLDRACE